MLVIVLPGTDGRKSQKIMIYLLFGCLIKFVAFSGHHHADLREDPNGQNHHPRG